MRAPRGIAAADALEGLVPIDRLGVVTQESDGIRPRGFYLPRDAADRKEAAR